MQKDFENEKSFSNITDVIKRGDIVGVVGKFGKSNTGELSIMASDVILLAPCLHVLPEAKKG